MLNIPYIQHQIATLVSSELSAIIGSKLSVGRIDIGLLNRIIIDNLTINDQEEKEMLKVARLSAKFDILPLFEGKVSINSVQLFGFNIQINKQNPKARPNFQFIVDTFASKDTIKKESNLDLRINSILIRRGRLSYDVLSENRSPNKFNPNHIRFNNISANISLKALNNDSINAAIKRLSIEEESGFQLKKLTFKLTANHRQTRIENFSIELPNTHLSTDTIRMEYDSLEAFKNLAHDVRFYFHLQPSNIVLKDISAFIPSLSSFIDPLKIEAKAYGSINQLELPILSITSPNNHFALKGYLSFQDLADPENAFIYGKMSRLQSDRQGTAFLVKNLSKKYEGVPSILQNLGNISFKGEITGYFNDLVTYGEVSTDVGNIRTDVKLSSIKDLFAYSGTIKTTSFGLGEMLSNDKVGKVTFDLGIEGKHISKQYPQITLKGLVSSIDYSNYTYRNITLDGSYKNGGFDGSTTLNDPNVSFSLNGNINTTTQVPSFNFLARLEQFRPHNLQLSSDYKDTNISLIVKANFTGGSIDEMKGEINLDSLQINSPEEEYFLPNLRISATQLSADQKRLNITSDFLEGHIEGDYSYKTLPISVTNIIHHYLPAVIPLKKQSNKKDNNFKFDLHIYNTKQLSSIFKLPLTIYTHSTLKGYFNDKTQRMRIEGYFPRLRYKEKFLESGTLLCENPHDQFYTCIRLSNRKKNDAINLSLEAFAQKDNIETILNWGNNHTITYSGKIAATTSFIRTKEKDIKKHVKEELGALKTIVDIKPTNIILNDTIWEIDPAKVVLDSGKIHIHDFRFSNEKRHLHIDGTLSKLTQDTIQLNLKDINIEYIFDIAKLGVSFRGEATGPVYACGVLEKPFMSTDLFIRNFGPFEGILGDANIHGEWHHDVKGIMLKADIQEGSKAQTHVNGYIYPIKPTSALDLNIQADGTKIDFIHYFMQSITPEFKGRVTGNVHLYGKFKALTMQGLVNGDATMKIDMLNTSFNVKDTILIEPGGLTFRNNRVFDIEGHEGRMNGYLHYKHFKNLEYNFNFSLNNMLVLNTKETPDFPFFGTIWGTGNASLSGNAQNGLNINLAVTPNQNSTFTYIKDYISTAANNQFVKFIDKTPKRNKDEILLSDFEIAQKETTQDAQNTGTDIRLNLQVEATPNATMKIIMDPTAGDYISGKGNGSLRAEFYNKGDFKLFGTYKLTQGVYKFSLQEVIRKDFIIRDGSSITFSGPPGDATLDIHAAYTVNSASLNDLMANANDYVNQTSVKVNCIMDISGQLTSPEIKLNLELPNEREEVQALVRNYIPTDEQIHMQILYLLGIGKFYTPENVDTQSSNMMSSVLSSTLSGQLNNAISNIINNNNWNIGTNFSTGEKGWTDMEFQGMLSGQLLNNRLLINGNFGYRENPMANTNFVGDFEAEWLVNRSGDIRLRAYNETNDRYYTRTNLTTQGIGIVFKKDFNKWSELLFWNKLKLRRIEKKKSNK